jgi:drug/metabolite transporter (DMT)-like permease
MKLPFKVPRVFWPELLMLAVTNMVVWHVLAILAIPQLSSGRAAILGYTMPIFASIIGALMFSDQLRLRAWGGVAAASVGVVLLLWHEFSNLSGSPVAVLMMLTGACVWALGTHQLRRTRMPVHILTLSFWFTAVTTVVMTLLSVTFERTRWHMPSPVTTASILYNALMVFGFAQAAWLYLARGLPPMASSLSVMFIPVLGVLSGAVVLNEVLHWQDWAAMVLMVVAIASVLLPSRAPRPPDGAGVVTAGGPP